MANGEFAPREAVQVWYNSNDQTATMISSKATPFDQKDLTTTRKWWFHYQADKGKWQDQGEPFPPDSADPPAKPPGDDEDV